MICKQVNYRSTTSHSLYHHASQYASHYAIHQSQYLPSQTGYTAHIGNSGHQGLTGLVGRECYEK